MKSSSYIFLRYTVDMHSHAFVIPDFTNPLIHQANKYEAVHVEIVSVKAFICLSFRIGQTLAKYGVVKQTENTFFSRNMGNQCFHFLKFRKT